MPSSSSGRARRPTPELAEELRDHCRSLIAGYKVPKAIRLRTEPLPKSGPGKILKRQLRDEHAAARAVRAVPTA